MKTLLICYLLSLSVMANEQDDRLLGACRLETVEEVVQQCKELIEDDVRYCLCLQNDETYGFVL